MKRHSHNISQQPCTAGLPFGMLVDARANAAGEWGF